MLVSFFQVRVLHPRDPLKEADKMRFKSPSRAVADILSFLAF